MIKRKRLKLRRVRVPKPQPIREDLKFMVGFVVIGYIIFSLFAYALVHPEKTQMQVWLQIWDALTWSW